MRINSDTNSQRHSRYGAIIGVMVVMTWMASPLYSIQPPRVDQVPRDVAVNSNWFWPDRDSVVESVELDSKQQGQIAAFIQDH